MCMLSGIAGSLLFLFIDFLGAEFGVDLNRSLNSRKTAEEMSLSLCEEFALAISTMKTSFFLIVPCIDFFKNCGKIYIPQSSVKGSVYSLG